MGKERKYSHYLEVQYIVGFLIDSLRVSSPECRAMSAIEGHLEHFLLWSQWHHNRKCSRWCWRALIALHSGDETLSESIKKLTIYWTSTLTTGFPWTNSGMQKVEKWNILRYRNIQFKKLIIMSLDIARIELNTIPNDSKLHAELENHNPEPRENDFWEGSKFTWF